MNQLFLKKWFPWVVFGVLAILIFHSVLFSGVLFSTDDNIGHLAMRKHSLPGAFFGGWNDSVLLGIPETHFLNWTNLLLLLLPVKLFTNWIHAIDLVVGSVFLAGFLRMKKVHPLAAIAGAITAYWLGSNFTLTYAGHIGKFGVMMFAAVSLFCIEKAFIRRSISWSILAGAALGMMYLEQGDVALFVSMAIGPYILFRLSQVEKGSRITAGVRVIPALVIAGLLMAAHSFLLNYQTAVKDVAAVSEEDPQGKWEFATQWSWPPEESIAFIAPGYTGWRSGEPAGPYWGRMGRSAGWEETGQGFQNFKLENTYVGVIPFALMLFALAGAVSCRQSENRAEIIFWGIALVISLLFAFGKYLPFYRLIYYLPVVNSIRNPNKFLQVFQLILGISAAFGLHTLLAGDAANDKVQFRKRFVWGGGVITAVFVLWAMWLGSAESRLIAAAQGEGWPVQFAEVIVMNKMRAIWHAAVMAGIVTGLFAVCKGGMPPMRRQLIGWTVVLVLVVDALMLSSNYIQRMPGSLIRKNSVVDVIENNIRTQRAFVATQQGFYNQWLTYLFPYYGIRTMNVTQMPRMPEMYQRFLEAGSKNMFRYWQMSAVGIVVGPAQLAQQLIQDPETKNKFDVLHAFNADPDGNNGVDVTPASAQRRGQHVVLRSRLRAPRFMLLGRWSALPSDKILEQLADPAVPLFDQAYLSRESLPENLPEPPMEDLQDEGEIQTVQARSGYVKLKVISGAGGILRFSEKYDLGWQVRVDGRAQPLLRCDYICCAAYVPAGVHEIEFMYKPNIRTIYVQFAGMLLAGFAGLGLILKKREN